MKPLITSDRLRSVIAAARTEKELVHSLRLHRIPFTWTTAPGYLAALVHTRYGSVYIYRAAGRSAPFVIRSAAPARSGSVPLFRSGRVQFHAPAGRGPRSRSRSLHD